jgi:hypothetical protein
MFMKNLWKYSVGLSLGLIASATRGEDINWTAAVPKPAGVIATSRTTTATPAKAVQPLGTAPRTLPPSFILPVGHTEQVVVPDPAPVQYLAIPPSNAEPPMPLPASPPSREGSGSPTIIIVKPEKADADQPELAPPPRGLEPIPDNTVVTPDDGDGSVVSSSPAGGCGDIFGIGTCGDNGSACSSCNACNTMWGCPSNRFYVSAEYLLWFMRPSNYPPLVTSGSVADAHAGAIGQPGTQVLFGNQGEPTSPFSGMRFTIGTWFDQEHSLGLEGSFFFLAPTSNSQLFASNSSGYPFIGRPFFDTATGIERAEIVSSPGNVAGNVNVITNSSLWGAEVNLRKNLTCCDWFHLDALAGFRTLGLDEGLFVGENLTALPTNTLGVNPGTNFVVQDSFNTTNRFYGGQGGLSAEFRLGRWFLDLNAKVAAGVTRQSVTINGVTFITDPGNPPPQAFVGGLLAQRSNIGTYSQNVFSIVPEAGLNIGCNVGEHFRIFAGYTFMYWSNVARPGEQVDRNVNSTQLPGAPVTVVNRNAPAFAFNNTDFWVHGVNVGLEYRY